MNGSHVLVVDDEAAVRDLLRGVLARHGYEVRAFGSAEDALAALSGWAPEVALVDLVLPGMSGDDLTREIRTLHPATAVVLMTGHDRSGWVGPDGVAAQVLHKPFAVGDVRQVVERALEGRRAPAEAASGDSGVPVPGEILEQYLEVVLRELEVERASLMLLDPATGELRIGASRGLVEVDPASVRVRRGEGIAGIVLESGKPFWSDHAHSDRRLDQHRADLSNAFVSAPIKLSVPIKAQCDVLGVINVTNRRSGRPFDADDVAFVQGLAGQLGVALDWARHAAELEGAYRSLKETQDRLVHTERIEAVGRMAAGVAHDFNNLLSVILARAELVRKRVESGSDDRQRMLSDLDSIVRTAWLGAETIKRIQDYTRIRKDVPTSPVDLDEVARKAVELARPKWESRAAGSGREIELRLELGGPPQVSGSEHELEQAVNNLLFNAVDAMPEGGRLTVRSRAEGGSAVLEVEDTGVGMDDATRRRLFDPFFTTKPAGQGLGTSIVYGIVSRHGGEIAVRSAPGAGSTFTLRLPAAQEARAALPRETRAPAGQFVAGRILLVDDEDLVRETYEDALQLHGHEAVGVADGVDALRCFRAGAFDVVITDLSMPGTSGLKLAEQIKNHAPDTPVILLSGWAVQEDQAEMREAGVDQILVKPCSIGDLLGAVQRALHSS